jgi:predicted alpha/beta superfamily hydrolase
MPVRNRSFSLLILASLVAVIASTGPVAAQEPEAPLLTIGHATTIYSRVLGEERAILVDLPSGYELTQTHYPVVILLDGLANFQHATATVDFLSRNGRIPQMIVIGIPNTARTRDFTPTRVDDRETSGGGEEFLRFVGEELVPFIDGRYRTQPYRVVFGHSLGGMFAAYALFTDPEVFGGYIAASPALDWDDGHVIGLAERTLGAKPELEKALYITLGDEPDYVDALKRFTRLLKKSKSSGLRWEYTVMEDDDHMSTPMKSLYQGLEMVFTDWRFPGDLGDADIPALQAHYEMLSDQFGYEILIPEGLLNQLGYLLLAREEYDDAIATFELNIENYPGSANVYDSLGEAYEAMNKLRLAKANYEKAYERGQEISDPNTRIYKLHLDNLLERLSGFD